MLFRTYKPAYPLSDFVEVIWYFEGDQASPRKERKLPDGRMQILIDLRDEGQSLKAIGVSGAYSEYFALDTPSQAQIMGVSFKAGGTFPFFKPPANELANVYVPLDLLWHAAADELRERLLAEHSLLNRFLLIENYLLHRAVRPLTPHPAVAFALREFSHSPRSTIGAVIDRTGFSNRRFIQLFSMEVGLTPKIFCRLLRFRKALRRLYQDDQLDLADLALGCGYYDQAHFSNDFKTFSGYSPTTYLSHRGPYLNHLTFPE
jgi:AraC-like DNA-binding protein